MPRISVIIPVLNGERYISAAVKSSLYALTKDSEVVVLDDNSTDGTFEVVDQIQDSRLRVIRRASGTGLAGALNELIDRTDSQYLARMDADDVTLPWRFHRQLALASSGVDFCFGSVLNWQPSSRRLRPARFDRITGDLLKLLLLLENPLAHSTAFYTRTSVEDIGGYRDVLAEDYDLWLRAAVNGYAIERLAEPVLIYRQHSSQVTAGAEWKLNSRVESELLESHKSLANTLLYFSNDGMSGIRSMSPTSAQIESSLQLVRKVKSRLHENLEGRGAGRLRRKVKVLEHELEEKSRKLSALP